MNDPLPTDALEVRESGVHGRGVFARRAIAAGTRLLEYFGERISKAESLRRCAAGNVYIIGLDEETDIDGSVPANLARLINHSCDPNCEAVIEEEVTLRVSADPAAIPGEVDCEGISCESRIYVDAVRDVSPGEEITFNYGYDLVDYHEHPCRCGASSCVGFIVAEAFFPELRRRLARARDRATAPDCRADPAPARQAD